MFMGGEVEAGPVGLSQRGQLGIELGKPHVLSLNSLATMRTMLKIGLTRNNGNGFIKITSFHLFYEVAAFLPPSFTGLV